jgi:hypothetical protein
LVRPSAISIRIFRSCGVRLTKRALPRVACADVRGLGS